jgi:D-beta-D-heptose 7-phosphate kinase/D-beta-D-heptose 1-phosphate adenosyltransferase
VALELSTQSSVLLSDYLTGGAVREAAEKVIDRQALKREADAVRRGGGRLVFTNGCFDLLHIGHVRYLQAARREGECLVVGVNSDSSVRLIKEPGRPVVPEDQRAEIVAALGCVDWVTVFAEPDPLELIRLLVPDVLVKGADWPEEEIIGAPEVVRAGGRVVRISFEQGISTSGLIRKICMLSHREP